MRRLAIRAACYSIALIAAADATAALLIPGSETWGKQMGSNPARMYQDPTNGVVGVPTSNLVLSMNSNFDGLTIAGQVTYTWTLSNLATTVAELAVADDELYATADIDPSFSTTAAGMTLSVTNVGYILSNDADWEMELWFPAKLSIPTRGGGPANLVSVSWPQQTVGTQGTAVNFSVTDTSPAPFQFSGMTGDQMILDTVGNGMWLKVRPPGGAQYFPANSTVSIVVDFPIIGAANVLPEPSTMFLLATPLTFLLAATLRLRRSPPCPVG